MNRQVSLKQVILNDYTAFMGFLFPIIFMGGYIIIRITGEAADNSLELLMIFGMISFFSVALLAWRISLFNSVFNDGLETPATISAISFFRDRGRISYIYIYQGQKYISGNAVMRSKRTRSYRVGDEVVVLVDRGKPRRAFLRDLYMA